MMIGGLLLTTYLLCGCRDNSTNPISASWQSLGFGGRSALRLNVVEPYLYVCAGSEGLWRRRIREENSSWEYLGLRDTSLGMYANVGVLEADVLGDDILVAYNGTQSQVVPESTVAIWQSTNGGKEWKRSDGGIPETINFALEGNLITDLQRAPDNPSIVLGTMEAATYKSVDGGCSWQLLFGRRGVIAGDGHLRWNPGRSGEVWFFGTTGLYAPFLFSMSNYGTDAKTSVHFDSLGYPHDGTVYDISFDAGNSNEIYAATSYGLLKTTDGGDTWLIGAIKLPDAGYVFRIASHRTKAGVAYFAGGRVVYSTYDGGKLVRVLGRLEKGFIQSLELDQRENQLFVGTDMGVYRTQLAVGE